MLCLSEICISVPGCLTSIRGLGGCDSAPQWALLKTVSHSGLLSPPSIGPASQGTAPLQEENPRDKIEVPESNSASSQVSRVPRLMGTSVAVLLPGHLPYSLGSYSSPLSTFQVAQTLCLIQGAHWIHTFASFCSMFRRNVQISRCESKAESKPWFQKVPPLIWCLMSVFCLGAMDFSPQPKNQDSSPHSLVFPVFCTYPVIICDGHGNSVYPRWNFTSSSQNGFFFFNSLSGSISFLVI